MLERGLQRDTDYGGKIAGMASAPWAEELRKGDEQSIAMGVFADQIPPWPDNLPPGATEMKWSPISSTLIFGERDAVLRRYRHYGRAKPENR